MVIKGGWEPCVEHSAPDERCAGVRVRGMDRCLRHLTRAELEGHIEQLSRDGDRASRRRPLAEAYLERVVTNLTATSEGGQAAGTRQEINVSAGTFTGDTHIRWTNANEGDLYCIGTAFAGNTYFDGTSSTRRLYLAGATFLGDVHFFGTDDELAFAREADFTDARFLGNTYFNKIAFTDDVIFNGTAFEGRVYFNNSTFPGFTQFFDVTFKDHTYFDESKIEHGDFTGAVFTRDIHFGDTKFTSATFAEATFVKGAHFGDVEATRLSFDNATFEDLQRLGPLRGDRVSMNRATFKNPVAIEAAPTYLSCVGTRFTGGAELRVRRSRVDLAEAFFGSASSLSTSSTGFSVDDYHPYIDHRPVLMSLRSTDVSELALSDVDLQWCRFAGAHHLDKLRIDGLSPFRKPPAGRWRTSRQVLFEEHLWRAERRPQAGWQNSAPWDGRGFPPDEVSAERLAAVYRSLRKALEDGKNEAGAGDFYYGEQEARRHGSTASRVEKTILWTYWLVSGYGQRASRALAALLLLIAVATALLIGFGLPGPGPAAQSTTTTAPGRTVTTTVDLPAQLPPAGQRWTWSRAGDATRIALGAVVFRDAGQKLTTAGTWVVMVARFFGPVLLALAALAIRARVKR
ncbi:pentapeptide repeat-containing protein [Amycolatopsis vancoresmycina]|uniref:pentapeptide repeat-containing protein n=1 Tax=Amycolatopsis vancoresmycina TaxID=208444 RepID=UPI0012DE3AFA|nr:pentapeptide repeat-containing protein [Amycolatopsis vancoresmycina]